jgi:hypothetical protein
MNFRMCALLWHVCSCRLCCRTICLGGVLSLVCLQDCQRTGGLVGTRTAIYPVYVNKKKIHERQTSEQTNTELRDRERSMKNK